MKIDANVILIWPSTNGTIPSRYVRKTSLDGKFAKAWGDVLPNLTGGNATHSHTSPTHQHSIADHAHDYQSSNNRSTGDDGRLNGDILYGYHYHTGTSTAISGGVTSLDSVTYGAVSNNPPYTEIIFIEAQSGAILQNGIVALWGGWDGVTDTPSGYQDCDGNGGSLDLRNKYLKGASAGSDAGATGGGYINVHDISHSHLTTSQHYHSGVSSLAIGYGGTIESDGFGSSFQQNHTHNVTLQNQTLNAQAYSGSLTTTETVEPLYKKLMAIMFKTGANKVRGLIGMTLLSESDFNTYLKPKGWAICDGTNGTEDMRNYHLKIANDKTEIGETGGSNTHEHGAQAHNHLGGSHAHSGVIDGHFGTSKRGGSFNYGNDVSNNTIVHTITSVTSVNADFQNANTTADSSNNEPEYRTVLFIQLQRIISTRPKIFEC